MEIPEGAKFMFISVPLVIIATLLIVYYVGKDDSNANMGLTEQNLNNISEGKDMNDFDKLEIETVREGSGPSAGVGDTVVLNYEGTFLNGEIFDSSYERETPFEFTLGEGGVIAGWEEGIKGMQVGEERTLKIPSDLAYGPEDYYSIPGGSGLIFKVELLEIK